MDEKGNVPYNAVRVVMDPARAPRQAHRFLYTRVGTDLVLDVGYHDMAELKGFVDSVREAGGDPEKPVNMPLYVTDRFVLSMSAAEDFVRTADFIREDLAKVRAAIAAQPRTEGSE